VQRLGDRGRRRALQSGRRAVHANGSPSQTIATVCSISRNLVRLASRLVLREKCLLAVSLNSSANFQPCMAWQTTIPQTLPGARREVVPTEAVALPVGSPVIPRLAFCSGVDYARWCFWVCRGREVPNADGQKGR
jgi:hypothetical protein